MRPAAADSEWPTEQSLPVATEWWLDFIQPSYCACMTWQFAQAAGSFVR